MVVQSNSNRSLKCLFPFPSVHPSFSSFFSPLSPPIIPPPAAALLLLLLLLLFRISSLRILLSFLLCCCCCCHCSLELKRSSLLPRASLQQQQQQQQQQRLSSTIASCHGRDENGRRKDDEWPRLSLPNDSGETGPSPVMALTSQCRTTALLQRERAGFVESNAGGCRRGNPKEDLRGRV
jgi:hypothetical protein